MDPKNKNVIITGASMGIGYYTAIEFAKAGANIALAARSEDRLKKLAVELQAYGVKAVAVPTDVSKRKDVNRMVQKTLSEFGGVDILINNAGVGFSASIEKMDIKDAKYVMEVNYFGCLYAIQAVIHHMREELSGQIINVSSVIGKRSFPYVSGYCAAKFALNALTESLRIELKRYGIVVILICPGYTRTAFHENVITNDTPKMRYGKGMSAEKVAQLISKASRKNKREVVVTKGGKLVVAVNKFIPGLVDFALHQFYKRVKSNVLTDGE